jgi:tRNA threonylcarbamoyladenosine biosynthesis protein TsaB
MLNSVDDARECAVRLLLLDTCGEGAGVAMSKGVTLLAKELLPRGGGSAEIVAAVQRVLQQASLTLRDFDGIGVVSGPGSFTGVRVGMAAAKGFAEATGVRMIAVSRLAVMAEASGVTDGIVALDAGRGECYAFEINSGNSGAEWLSPVDDLVSRAKGREIVVAEEKLATRLKELAPELNLRMHALQVEDALSPLLRGYRKQPGTMILADANYLRRESDIYKKNAAGDA